MRVKVIAVAVSCAIVASCSTTEQANEVLASRFIGTKADAFFVEYGPPSQGYRTSDGQTVYIWADEAKTYYVPPSAYTTVDYVGNTAFSTTNFYGGSAMEVQCQVKILADSRGKIVQIEAHKDTWGDWETSRCHEKFSLK